VRILQVCPIYGSEIGGVSEHVINISERLATKHEVVVYSTDPSGKFAKKEIINLVEVNRFKAYAPNNLYFFSRALEKNLATDCGSFDIVHAHSYHAFPALYAARKKNRNKLIFTPHYHGHGHTFFRNLLHTPYKFVAKKILDVSDCVICVSEYERSLLTKNFKIDQKKIVVIPNGINQADYVNMKKHKQDQKTILYVGRLEKYKGVQYLIRVLPELGSNISLQIVGSGSYANSLSNLTRKLGVTKRVTFFHDLPRKELLRKFADASIFSLLSTYEAYGLVVAEALASKTPCLVTKTSALTEWIDEKNCFGIDYPVDIKTLGKQINAVIGREITGVLPPDWNDIVKQLEYVYSTTFA
jgi:glycosyltransferase involved in cell wall biosynthesis